MKNDCFIRCLITSYLKIIRNFKWQIRISLDSLHRIKKKRFFFFLVMLIFHFKQFFLMNFHEVYKYFRKIFLFCSHILIFHLLQHGATYIHWSLENYSFTYGTSLLFGLFGLFKSYVFFSKRLHFYFFEKALIDILNLSISFVPIEFVIFFIKYASWTLQCCLENSNISICSKVMNFSVNVCIFGR